MSPNPWVQGGGWSDYLLQNSKARVDEFLKLGVSSAKIHLTGDPALDLLHQAWERRTEIRLELAAVLGSTAESPIVVMSIPNDPEHGLGTFAEHRERMNSYFRCISNAGIKCLLSLHPKSKPAIYEDLARKWGHVILARPLAEYLPAADLFICSASTTILWAQLVNVPTLNLNYLGLDDDPDYSDMPGITEISNEDGLRAALLTWWQGRLRSPAFMEHAEKLRRNSLFDGAAGQRLCDLVEALTDKLLIDKN